MCFRDDGFFISLRKRITIASSASSMLPTPVNHDRKYDLDEIVSIFSHNCIQRLEFD